MLSAKTMENIRREALRPNGLIVYKMGEDWNEIRRELEKLMHHNMIIDGEHTEAILLAAG